MSTSLINLSVEYYSPIIAKEWVDKLVAAINSHLRVRDRDEASKSIQFLERQISQTSLAEMKNVFYQLVEEQTKNLMLTEISDEYVLKTLSPARIPEEKSRPNRALICIGGTLLGFVFALLLVFLRSALTGFSTQQDVKLDRPK
jgi:LPS O-antigen subunit length determinant protein (WzzB/FepE family)